MLEIIKNKKGATAILMTMLILAGILFIGLTASQLVNNGLILGKTQVNSTKAYFAAEAGAERILWGVRSFPSEFEIDECETEKCFSYGMGGEFANCKTECDQDAYPEILQILSNDSDYKIEYIFNDPLVIFKSLGSFTDVSRAIEAKFSIVLEICDDLIDNDGDGDIDCADTVSCGTYILKCEYPESTCDDSFDNDGDGDIDMADPDC